MTDSISEKTLRPAIPALTGLRFVAAFSVLLAHSMHWIATFSKPLYITELLGASSGIGMPLFFVLSGFVIHYNYSHYFKRLSLDAFVRFMIARFARLYPLYILLLMLIFFEKNILFWNAPFILRFLTLTQAWLLTYIGHTWVGHFYFSPAWSVSVEWFLYILYALVGVYLLTFKTVFRCLIAFFVFVTIYDVAVMLLFPHMDALNEWTILTYAADVKPQSALMGWLFNTGPGGRFFEFSMGMLAAQIFLLQHPILLSVRHRIVLNALMYISLIAVALIFVNPWENSLVAFGRNTASFMSPFLAILIFVSARNVSWFAKIMSCNFFVMLGEASYSMYLLHAIFLPSFNIGTLDQPNGYWLSQVILAMTTIIVASILMYRFYEKPMQYLLRKILNKQWNFCVAFYMRQFRYYSLGKILPIIMAATFIFFVGYNNRPELTAPIQIVQANYGENCEKLAITEKSFANRFHAGNATVSAQQLCLRKGVKCTYNVELDYMGGDPVPGCAKDYSITYHCKKDNVLRTLYIPGEAYGKLIKLAC